MSPTTAPPTPTFMGTTQVLPKTKIVHFMDRVLAAIPALTPFLPDEFTRRVNDLLQRERPGRLVPHSVGYLYLEHVHKVAKDLPKVNVWIDGRGLAGYQRAAGVLVTPLPEAGTLPARTEDSDEALELRDGIIAALNQKITGMLRVAGIAQPGVEALMDPVQALADKLMMPRDDNAEACECEQAAPSRERELLDQLVQAANRNASPWLQPGGCPVTEVTLGQYLSHLQAYVLGTAQELGYDRGQIPSLVTLLNQLKALKDLAAQAKAFGQELSDLLDPDSSSYTYESLLVQAREQRTAWLGSEDLLLKVRRDLGDILQKANVVTPRASAGLPDYVDALDAYVTRVTQPSAQSVQEDAQRPTQPHLIQATLDCRLPIDRSIALLIERLVGALDHEPETARTRASIQVIQSEAGDNSEIDLDFRATGYDAVMLRLPVKRNLAWTGPITTETHDLLLIAAWNHGGTPDTLPAPSQCIGEPVLLAAQMDPKAVAEEF